MVGTDKIVSLSFGRRNREDGNVAFQSGDYSLALMLYSEAMRYAPDAAAAAAAASSSSSSTGSGGRESEELAAAAANRSATLFQLGRFQECLQVGSRFLCNQEKKCRPEKKKK